MKKNFKLFSDGKNYLFSCLCVPVEIYKCEIYFMLPRQTRKLEKLWGNKLDYAARTRDYLESHGHILITFNQFNEENLVHELYHTVDFITKKRGMTNRGEASAYLMSYIFKEFKKNV